MLHCIALHSTAPHTKDYILQFTRTRMTHAHEHCTINHRTRHKKICTLYVPVTLIYFTTKHIFEDIPFCCLVWLLFKVLVHDFKIKKLKKVFLIKILQYLPVFLRGGGRTVGKLPKINFYFAINTHLYVRSPLLPGL